MLTLTEGRAARGLLEQTVFQAVVVGTLRGRSRGCGVSRILTRRLYRSLRGRVYRTLCGGFNRPIGGRLGCVTVSRTTVTGAKLQADIVQVFLLTDLTVVALWYTPICVDGEVVTLQTVIALILAPQHLILKVVEVNGEKLASRLIVGTESIVPARVGLAGYRHYQGQESYWQTWHSETVLATD